MTDHDHPATRISPFRRTRPREPSFLEPSPDRLPLIEGEDAEVVISRIIEAAQAPDTPPPSAGRGVWSVVLVILKIIVGVIIVGAAIVWTLWILLALLLLVLTALTDRR